jgi:choice-of-anchor A domain-containing protein
MSPNAQASIQYQGLTLTCNSPNAPAYYVNINANVFNDVTYYNDAVNCNPNAQVVFNIRGTGAVQFQGNHFNWRQEKVLYNIVNSGPSRSVGVITEVRGSILAPNSEFIQTGGVVKGHIIVGTVTASVQINRLVCEPPAPPPTNPPEEGLCPGWEGQCQGLDFPLGDGVYSFRDFNVITFQDFNAATGDIEGRLAAKRDVTLGTGYSIGFELKTFGNIPDRSLPYSLVAGRNVVWGSGSLHPDGTGIPYPGDQEFLFAGGDIDSTNYLELLHTGTCQTAGCLDGYFNAAQQCYFEFQTELAAHTDNVEKVFKWTGLFLTCDSMTAPYYYVTINAEEFATFTYTSLDNCNVQANWIINVPGTGDFTLSGGSFPGVPGGVTYNIQGTGRTVHITSVSVDGHILAPGNTIDQTGGVIRGKVVAGNIMNALQINRENTCPEQGVIENPTTVRMASNSQSINVETIGNARAGDVVTFEDNSEATITSVDPENRIINVNRNVQVNEGDLVIANINRVAGRRDTSDTWEDPISGASSVQVAVIAVALLAALL